MRHPFLITLIFVLFLGVFVSPVSAQKLKSPITGPTLTATPTPTPEPTSTPRPDFTQKNEETVIGPLEQILSSQKLGNVTIFNFVRHAIQGSVKAGIPPNTIVLLLLLPLIAALIAAARHIVGLRGFGIFLPAALAVAFVAIGPIVGILLFFIIVLVSTLFRISLRKIKVRLQYLPRMSLILWFVSISVLGILFLAPYFDNPDITGVSIFSVLILALLAEDFSKVQLGKSARTAISLATETIILALLSYAFLATKQLQEMALLYPELLLVSVAIFDVLLGKYVGLRFFEYWRYRKLITSK